MRPETYESEIDVLHIDEEFEPCTGFGFSSCSRVPARTVEMSPILLSQLVLQCSDEGVHD